MPKATKRKKEKKADFQVRFSGLHTLIDGGRTDDSLNLSASQKTKLKLGKGKQAASNATDISFKARTIALPQQSIASDKSGKLVNSRNLAVSELALQLRHYSANVRKDAVLGIKDILNLHPILLTSALGQLLPELVRCIGDDDPSVRKQVYGLLTWMLPQIAPQLLAPYHNTLLLFTTSALSHIYSEVRIDAVKILDICLELFPDVSILGWENAIFTLLDSTGVSSNDRSRLAATAGPGNTAHHLHGERIMNCLLNLVGITQRSSASASITATDLTQRAKLGILGTLKTFLAHALPKIQLGVSHEDLDSNIVCPTWFFRSTFANQSDYEYFESILDQSTKPGQGESVDEDTGTWSSPYKIELHSAAHHTGSMMDLENTAGKSIGTRDMMRSLQTACSGHVAPAARSASLDLYTLLHPVLLATFLDSAPSAFQPDMDIIQVPASRPSQNVRLSDPAQLLYELLTLILTLWRSSTMPTAPRPSTAACNSLSSILGHMSVYFPFSEQMGLASNMSYKARALVVQMDLAYAELTALLSRNKSNASSTKIKYNLEAQMGHVSAFITHLLATPVSGRGTVTLASVNSGYTLDMHTFQSLLPTLWFLLGRSDHDTLLDSLLASYHGYGSLSRTKPVLFEFLARIYLLSYASSKQLKAVSEDTTDKVITSLLSTLPRTLWEASNSSSTHHLAGLLLQFLHFVLLLPASSPKKLAYDALRPFYCFKHPTKGKMVPGPFIKLPPALRKLALDNAALLKSEDLKLAAAIQAVGEDYFMNS